MRTLAHISDLHFGRHDESAVEALLASLDHHRPDLVVVSGDFTQRARRSEFALASAFLARIAAPKLIVPGNHDVPLYDIVGRFLTPLSKYQRYIASAGVPGSVFADEEIAVLGLSTARSFAIKNGRISLKQVEKIRQVFERAPAAVTRILVTHHPLETPRDALPLAHAGRSVLAIDAVAAVDVHLLLSGHYHRAVSGTPHDEIRKQGFVLVIHAGTATSTRTRGSESNTWNLLTIAESRLVVRVMRWDAANNYAESRSTSYVREHGRWEVELDPALRRR